MAFPGRHEASGLVWSVAGTPYTKRTTIRLLLQGKFKGCLRDHPELLQQAHVVLVQALQQNTPVHTGQLAGSIRLEHLGRAAVSIGPQPYNRQKLIAAIEGRVYKQRKRRIKMAKYYAIPANERSGRPSYIERSIGVASVKIATICSRLQEAEAKLVQVEAAVRTPRLARAPRSTPGSLGEAVRRQRRAGPAPTSLGAALRRLGR